MHISSQEPPVVRRIAHQCYLGVASLILIGMVSEGLLIGPSLFFARMALSSLFRGFSSGIEVA